MSTGETDRRIPVTVLTGFLGAGKSTVLGRLLQDARFRDTAVIVNEFGEIALDHELIDSADETIVETTSGCLCCTVQGDVRRTVLSLVERARAGDIRPFSRIVIETTGLADPAPVLQTFMADPALQTLVALTGVVALVDAVSGLSTLERFEEARRQVACADIILITKTDLLPREEAGAATAGLRDRINGLNGAARKVDVAEEGVAPTSILDLPAYDPSDKAPDVLAWLQYEAASRAGGGGFAEPETTHAHPHTHDHAHHHDPNRHGDDVRAYCFAFDAPLSAGGFWFALEMLQAYQGERLLRFKGLVGLDDAPGQPVVVHAVQHVTSPPTRLDRWPSSDRRTRLVLIVKDIPEADIRETFALFQRPVPDVSRGLL